MRESAIRMGLLDQHVYRHTDVGMQLRDAGAQRKPPGQCAGKIKGKMETQENQAGEKRAV